MNLSNCIKDLIAFGLFFGVLFILPNTLSAQKMVKGEVLVDVYTFIHEENFPCGAGYGDIMQVDIDVEGDLSGTETIDFKVWLDTPSNQNSNDLLIEYPTEITTKNGLYYVDYLGMGFAGDLNFRLTADGFKPSNTSLVKEDAYLNCAGVATIIVNNLLLPDDIPTPMFDGCLIYYDVWLTNIYCVGSSYNYTMPGKGSLAHNGECFQAPNTSRVVKQQSQVSPNPFFTNLSVQLEGETRALTLADINGRIVHEELTEGKTETSIDTNALPAGVYFLSILSEQGMEVQKLVRAN